MASPVHVVVTLDDVYSSSASSPQLPGWLMVRPTSEALLGELTDELDRMSAGPDRVVHKQRYVQHGRRVFLLRHAADALEDQRWVLEDQIVENAIAGLPAVNSLMEDDLGVIGILVGMRTDLVRWVEEQLEGSHAWALAVPTADGDLSDWVYRQVASEDLMHADGVHAVRPPRGIRKWSLGQLVDSAPTWEPSTGVESAPKTAAMFELLDGMRRDPSVAVPALIL